MDTSNMRKKDYARTKNNRKNNPLFTYNFFQYLQQEDTVYFRIQRKRVSTNTMFVSKQIRVHLLVIEKKSSYMSF